MLIPSNLHEGFVHVLLVLVKHVMLEGVNALPDVDDFMNVVTYVYTFHEAICLSMPSWIYSRSTIMRLRLSRLAT